MEAARLMHDEDAGAFPEAVTIGEIASRGLVMIDPSKSSASGQERSSRA